MMYPGRTGGRVDHAGGPANAEHALGHARQHAAHGDQAVLLLLNCPDLQTKPP